MSDLQKVKEIVTVQPIINEIMNNKKTVDHEKIRDLFDLFKRLRLEGLDTDNIKEMITKSINSLRKKQEKLGEEIVMTAKQGKQFAPAGGRRKTKKRTHRYRRRKVKKTKKAKKAKKKLKKHTYRHRRHSKTYKKRKRKHR